MDNGNSFGQIPNLGIISNNRNETERLQIYKYIFYFLLFTSNFSRTTAFYSPQNN